MKKQFVCILAICIIFLSSLNLSMIIRPSFGEPLGVGLTNKTVNGSSSISSSNQASGYSGTSSSVWQSAFDEQSQQSSAPSTWNFSNISGWSKFAYVDGNETRLIVGLNNAGLYKIVDVESLFGEYGARLVDSVSVAHDNEALVVELPLSMVTAFTGNLQTLGLTRYVEPDMKVQISFEPNDQYWNLQWGPRKIQADWAWNTTLGSRSVLVAIVDTGIDYDHPDLIQNYVPLGYNWVSNNSNPLDDYGHGTHVAGIIAATINNSIGIAGLAQVRIMAEKCFDASGIGYDDVIAHGILDASEKGAKIISMSFGSSEDSQLIHDAIKAAYDNGSLLVAAAGNDDSNEKFYPAAYPEVVSVAATDQMDNKASFSNWGDWIELAAPGVDIYSTMPTYQVTLNSYGYAMNYDYLSGTSMACPCVSGVAALVWSVHPNATRDWLRLWLRYTADDLGVPGFDEYYGYGRINARKAVTESPPQHDVVADSWSTPPFIKPGTLATINATVLNFGASDETNVIVNLLANGTTVDTTSTGLITEGNTKQVSLYWTPTIQGLYNLTLHVNPVAGQTDTRNNVLWTYIYVGVPIKAVVLRSAGNMYITDWQTLNDQWYLFGSKMVVIDYTTLNKEDITYSDIAATGADVLIISCAAGGPYGSEFTDAEINAITEYIREGHGLVATAGTFYAGVPNNNKLAPLFGLSENVSWSTSDSDLMNLVNASNPFLNKIPNPFIFPDVETAVPPDGQWDASVLEGGTYLALGNFLESAVVTFRGLVYISPWLEIIPPYYHYPLQLLYNAITVSKYQAPQHDLEVSLQCPQYVKPGESALVNATVTNLGLSNETNVVLQLFINGTQAKTITATKLNVDSSTSLQYLWSPTSGIYNVTAYAPPVTNETFILNNIAVGLVTVTEPLINPVEGQYADYSLVEPPSFTGDWNITYVHYISPYEINITMSITSTPYFPENAWIIVNVFTRIVEQDSGIGWSGMWYPGWIGTSLTIGSQVPVLYANGTVVGSDIIFVNGRAIDCWKVSEPMFDYTYDFWYDKASGLWIAMQITGSFSETVNLKTTNVLLGYAHDVAAMLNAPSLVAPGQSAILNATVYNVGRNEEANVTIQLIINETVLDSKVISALDVGNSYTLSYSWTPTVQGEYNVTAYVLPVPNENDTANNIFTKSVRVGPVKGHILFDQGHGTDNVNLYSIWIENLTSEGYDVDILNGPVTQATLEKYDVFVTAQASIGYNSSETSALQNFVLNGHGLLVMGSNYPYLCTNLTGFAGIGWNSTFLAYSGFMSDITSHPITNGVTTAYFLPSWSILSVASPATSIIRDPGARTLLAVSEVGLDGKVVAVSTGGSFTDVTIGFADNLRLALNIVEWLAWKDTTPPSISVVSPVNGTITRNTTLLVEWVGSDNDTRIYRYEVYLNGSLVDGNVPPTTTSYTFSGLTQGTYNVTVVAYDMGLNTASDHVIVVVHTVPPPITLISPTNGSYVRGQVSVNTTAGSDEYFKNMTLYIDGSVRARYNKTGSYAYVWNTTGLAGQHTILLEAVDQLGNAAQAQVQVTVDNVMPVGEIMQPVNATYVRGVISIQVYSYDQDLESTKVFIDQVLQSGWGNETGIHQLLWNTTTVQDGTHTINLSVVDQAGNTLEQTVSVIVDNTSPQVSIGAPAPSSNVNGTVNINFVANDTNLKTILLYIDNAVYNVTGQTTYPWNSEQVGDGSHTIRVVATDKAGNVGQAQITVTTSRVSELLQRITDLGANVTKLNKNNSALQQTILQLQYAVAGIIIAVAVVATLGYIVLRRKPSAPKRA